MKESNVPKGRWSRLARMAALGARSGASQVLGRMGGHTAEDAARVLGELRGLATKVGQMASYVDGVVPEAHREVFERELGRLRANAHRSSPDDIRAVVESELGAPVHERFAEWSDTPIASASIGQVHEGRLLDGTRVAVKVQHPGVASALESDLANAKVLEAILGTAMGHREASRQVLASIAERFREELDYTKEADNQRFFRALHAADPNIDIPQVIETHSRRRVLTTTFVDGDSFERACEAPEPLRVLYAQTLWRFVFRGNLLGGRFNADPHPGNYVFHPAGRITFFDHGCVQPIAAEKRQLAIAVHRAVLDRNHRAFRDSAAEMLETKGGPLRDAAVDYMHLCFEPLWQAPYRITREYSASLAPAFRDLALLARRVPQNEFFSIPPSMVFLNRLQFGFYSLLARLNVEVDYAAVERAFLDDPTPEHASAASF